MQTNPSYRRPPHANGKSSSQRQNAKAPRGTKQTYNYYAQGRAPSPPSTPADRAAEEGEERGRKEKDDSQDEDEEREGGAASAAHIHFLSIQFTECTSSLLSIYSVGGMYKFASQAFCHGRFGIFVSLEVFSTILSSERIIGSALHTSI